MADESATTSSGPRADVRVRPLLLVVAAALWLWSTFAHGFGTDVAREYFTWAQGTGTLAADGGIAGFRTAEALVMGAFVVTVVAAVALALRRRRDLPVLHWVLWAVFAFLVWKTVIVYASELVHFLQYGLIGGLLTAALGGAARVRPAFLLAVLLGALDEAWQHWGIALAIEGNLRHGFDWSDLILNATGAAGGALLFVRRGPREQVAGDPGERPFLAVVAVLSALLLPVLLLDRTTLADVFGTYTYHPFWNELENGKPVHWMTPVDGIPLFLAATLFLGLLLGGRRRPVGTGAALALVALVTLAVQPPTRLAPRPVHEVVPMGLAARAANGAIELDGRLDEAVWKRADVLGPFVHGVTGAGHTTLPGGSSSPLARTTARMAWDDVALYIAFTADDADIWARDVAHDDPTLPGDEVVEVFLDPDGDEITYYEIEVSPAGVTYDLFNVIPAPPSDYNPWAPFLGLADWDARGLRAAVAVDGTLDVVQDFEPARAIDGDVRWTTEIAVPWSVFRTTTTPNERTVVRLPPRPGARWRVGLYRVERPRAVSPGGRPLGRREAGDLAQLQAWSPPHMDSFHRPERFGVIEFADAPER